MKIIHKFLFRFVLLVNIVIALLLYLSFISPWISPQKVVFFGFCGISFPIWVFLNLLFVIYWLFRFRWFFLLSFSALLISSARISDYFPLHRKTDVPVTALKLLTYNCMNFGDMRGPENSKNTIFDYLKESQADIICLQEFSFIPKNKVLSEESIKKTLKDYPYYKFVCKDSKNSPNNGIACFSKYPIVKVERIDFESQYNQSAAFTIQIKKGKELLLINNHLESNKLSSEDKAIYSKAITTLNVNLLDDVRHSLLEKLAVGYRLRSKQAESIRDFMNKQTHERIIVCGDFNDTVVSYAYQTVRGDLKDAYGDTSFGMGATFNRDFFFFRIDHILYTKTMKAYNCTIDKVKYSDHYPVSCYFELD